jgi:hypothetical protein
MCNADCTRPLVLNLKPGPFVQYIHAAKPADGDEEIEDEVVAFVHEQVHVLYLPDLNTLISIDGNGEKSWDGVTELLPNDRCLVRTSSDASVLIYKLIDAMIDGVYPLLDLYGDSIEGLEFVMMTSAEPTHEHVRTSVPHPAPRRVHHASRVSMCSDWRRAA